MTILEIYEEIEEIILISVDACMFRKNCCGIIATIFIIGDKGSAQ